jgi:hypothetical protein
VRSAVQDALGQLRAARAAAEEARWGDALREYSSLVNDHPDLALATYGRLGRAIMLYQVSSCQQALAFPLPWLEHACARMPPVLCSATGWPFLYLHYSLRARFSQCWLAARVLSAPAKQPTLNRCARRQAGEVSKAVILLDELELTARGTPEVHAALVGKARGIRGCLNGRRAVGGPKIHGLTGGASGVRRKSSCHCGGYRLGTLMRRARGAVRGPRSTYRRPRFVCAGGRIVGGAAVAAAQGGATGRRCGQGLPVFARVHCSDLHWRGPSTAEDP